MIRGDGVRGDGRAPMSSPGGDLGALFSRYDLPGAYDEMCDSVGAPREHYRALIEELLAASPTDQMK